MKHKLNLVVEIDCPEEQLPMLIGSLRGVIEQAAADGRITGGADAALLGYRVEVASLAAPDRTVQCQFCGALVPANTAHRHGNGWVGDECCWDERLRSSE